MAAANNEKLNISLKLKVDLVDEIDKISIEEEQTRSAIMRRALVNFVRQHRESNPDRKPPSKAVAR